MEKLLLLSFTALLTITSCNKDEKGTPKCLNSKINEFEAYSCPAGANVKKYSFQNRSVFVFDPGNCGADMASEVLDSECNSIGYLGGITGNNRINNEDFSNAQLVETVWTK